MEHYHYLLDLVFILLGTKIFGILFKRLKMPQVVGALFAGILIGPAVLNIVVESQYITVMSEIGVIVLMFLAGMEADVGELKKAGFASFVIAMLGVIVPLGGGYLLYAVYNPILNGIPSDAHLEILQNVFIGVILTATSVSISVETLKEMGKLNSRAGNAILGAAIIDDILGIVVLAVISGLAKSGDSTGTGGGVGIVLLKILGFFLFTVFVGLIFRFFLKKWTESAKGNHRRYVIVCFAFCLFMAYISEAWFEVADITGAFIAGLMLTGVPKKTYIIARCDTMSYSILSPIFFASIGLKVVRPQMDINLIVFTVLLLIVAVLTKMIGCYIGAKMCKYTRRESVQICSGMISRGEVALIVAKKGISSNLLSQTVMAPVIIVVVLTTIIAPIFLKLSFSLKRKQKGLKASV